MTEEQKDLLQNWKISIINHHEQIAPLHVWFDFIQVLLIAKDLEIAEKVEKERKRCTDIIEKRFIKCKCGNMWNPFDKQKWDGLHCKECRNILTYRGAKNRNRMWLKLRDQILYPEQSKISNCCGANVSIYLDSTHGKFFFCEECKKNLL